MDRNYTMSIYPECSIPLVVSSKINRKIQTINNYGYEIWNYDNDYVCFDEKQSIKNCRSVLFSYPQHNLLSIGPGKTTDSEKFCEKHDCNGSIYVNEYIDGTMVHLFYDKRRKIWEISSKSHIGGSQKLQNYQTKTNKTLMEMFKEGLGYDSVSDLQNMSVIKDFPKNYSYQFVLLHPENVILYPIKQSLLYLVAVYDITQNTRRAIHIPPMIYEKWYFLQNTTILFPTQKKIDKWEEISKEQQSVYQVNENISGYMVLHIESGERTKIMNPHYIQSKELNKISPRLGLYYLCLHKRDLVNEYLVFFPQFRKTFRKFQGLFHDYIEELHSAYLVKYVWKNALHGKINDKYNPYVDDIHRELYIPSLKTDKRKITKQTVYQYMMNKPPGEILYILCSCRRKSAI